MSESPPCKIYLHRQYNYFGSEVENQGRDLQTVADELTASTFETSTGTARMRRVVKRLLQHFPWETCKDDVWLGCHPLDDPSVVSTPRVLVVNVAAARAEDLLRVLMPLTRQLFVSVAVPSFDLFVEYGHSVETTNIHPRHLVARFDSGCLSKPDLDATVAYLAKGLKEVLEPLGFTDIGKVGGSLSTFERPLAGGGGKQVLGFDGANGIVAYAKSERFREVRAKTSGFPGFELDSSGVVELFLGEARKRIDPGWIGDDPGGMGWEEEMLWAIEDMTKILVPLMQCMQSSKDLFDWYFDAAHAKMNRSSFSDWSRDIKDKGGYTNATLALYAARYLPDEQFFPMLDEWMQILKPLSETHRGALAWLKLAEVLRILPQTPDGPM
jgi:hypothetical protein